MLPNDALTTLAGLAEQRHRDPLVSIEGATAILATDPEPRVAAAACQVIALAEHELGRLNEAVAHYRTSIAIVTNNDLVEQEARYRANLATSLLAIGDVAGAEQEIGLALGRASRADRGVVNMRHGVVLQRTGRLIEALAVYQRALRWLVESGDEPYQALVYLNRGILHAYQGGYVAALSDLGHAEEISRRRNLPVLVAMATHNIGFTLVRLGRLPDALSAFARAEAAYAALRNPDRLVAVLEADRCEALLLSGLAVEARLAAGRAVEALVSLGDVAHLMEARLLLARTQLSSGDYPAAVAEAGRAARGFTTASRRPWAALARYVAIQAEILQVQDQATVPPGLLGRCRRIADALEAQGWMVESVHIRTFAGRVALALGHPRVARSELAHAVAARSRGTADLRAQAWHAEALLRLAENNRRGAKRALGRGMAVVDEYQASLGATELRAHASSLATDLARLGMGLALEERRAVDVLRWAERWRAGALSRPPVRPPDDDLLAAHLVELRQAQSDLRTAALGAPGVSEKAGPQKAGPQKTGREKGATAASRTMALRAQIAELEKAIRDQTRQAPDHAVATGRIEVAALRLALGPRCLVEYVALEGHLYAVTVSRDRTRLHDLGTSMVDDEKRYLLFALRRLWSSPLRRGAEDALAATAARVDAMLMTPLGLPPDAPLVVIPTGVLHGLPWSALPSVANRPTVVAPSAALWLGTAAQGHRPPEDSPPSGGRDRSKRRSAALVAGPGLPGADREVALIAEMYPGTVPLTGALATADAAMAALGTADVAHLAAHGRFRSDSPMFSSVLLADGPVTVYDLERLSHAPTVVVLASCDAAVSAVQLGDELLGTAAALIGIGVRSVIGPVMAVPDGATAAFMVALHRRLQAGDPPATALVSARAGQDRAIGDAFICIGCNDPATAAPEGVTATA